MHIRYPLLQIPFKFQDEGPQNHLKDKWAIFLNIFNDPHLTLEMKWKPFLLKLGKYLTSKEKTHKGLLVLTKWLLINLSNSDSEEKKSYRLYLVFFPSIYSCNQRKQCNA